MCRQCLVCARIECITLTPVPLAAAASAAGVAAANQVGGALLQLGSAVCELTVHFAVLNALRDKLPSESGKKQQLHICCDQWQRLNSDLALQ